MIVLSLPQLKLGAIELIATSFSWWNTKFSFVFGFSGRRAAKTTNRILEDDYLLNTNNYAPENRVDYNNIYFLKPVEWDIKNKNFSYTLTIPYSLLNLHSPQPQSIANNRY